MSARTDPEGASERLEKASRSLTWQGQVWRVIKATAATCMRYRVTGLAAEAAFFGVLSLPPLIFGLAGAVGFVTSTLDIRTIAGFREQLLELSGRILTPDVVETVIEPTIDDVLSRGQAAVISIGFLIALWSGSRALNVFIETTTIMTASRCHSPRCTSQPHWRSLRLVTSRASMLGHAVASCED